MKTNRNELIRRLLSGVPEDELEHLVRVREEARRPIPAPRKMGVKQLIRFFQNNPIPLIPAPQKRTSMWMMRSNETNSMKIDYWDEVYPDDKIYIRPEDGKNLVLWMAFVMQSTQFTYFLRLQKMG